MAQRILDFLKNLSWRNALIICALGAAYFYFTLDTSVVDDLQNNIQMLNAEATTLAKKVKEAKEFEVQFEDRKKKYVERVKELQAKQGALPKQFFLPDLLSDLLKEAKQLELEIISIQPDAKEETKNLYSSWGFNLEFRGTFVQNFIFLDRLAHMKRLADVKMFTFSRDTSRQSVTLGGEDGAFAETKMGGGQSAYPGIASTIRVLTYRYRTTAEIDKDKKPQGAPAKAPRGKS